jgi:hypothetical protein
VTIDFLDDQTSVDDCDGEHSLIISTHDNRSIDIGSLLCPPSKLLEYILGTQQYDNYRIARARVFVMRTQSRAHAAIIEQAFYTRARYSEREMTRADYSKQDIAFSRNIQIEDLTPEHCAQCDEVIKYCELFVARVSKRIAQDDCPICYTPLCETEAIAIMRCCGLCLCANCCISVMFSHQSDTIQNAHGRCVQCRYETNVVNDIVFVREHNSCLDLLSKMIKDTDEESICARKNTGAGVPVTLAPIKTKIDYVIELARSGCVPNNIRYVNVQVYNGLTNSTNVDTIITSVEQYESDDRAQSILVYSSIETVVKTLRIAARAESIRECEITVGVTHVSLINSSNIVPAIIDTRVTFMPWITDIVIIDTIHPNFMAQLINLVQVIGRMQRLRIHMLKYIRA